MPAGAVADTRLDAAARAAGLRIDFTPTLENEKTALRILNVTSNVRRVAADLVGGRSIWSISPLPARAALAPGMALNCIVRSDMGGAESRLSSPATTLVVRVAGTGLDGEVALRVPMEDAPPPSAVLALDSDGTAGCPSFVDFGDVVTGGTASAELRVRNTSAAAGCEVTFDCEPSSHASAWAPAVHLSAASPRSKAAGRHVSTMRLTMSVAAGVDGTLELDAALLGGAAPLPLRLRARASEHLFAVLNARSGAPLCLAVPLDLGAALLGSVGGAAPAAQLMLVNNGPTSAAFSIDVTPGIAQNAAIGGVNDADDDGMSAGTRGSVVTAHAAAARRRDATADAVASLEVARAKISRLDMPPLAPSVKRVYDSAREGFAGVGHLGTCSNAVRVEPREGSLAPWERRLVSVFFEPRDLAPQVAFVRREGSSAAKAMATADGAASEVESFEDDDSVSTEASPSSQTELPSLLPPLASLARSRSRIGGPLTSAGSHPPLLGALPSPALEALTAGYTRALRRSQKLSIQLPAAVFASAASAPPIAETLAVTLAVHIPTLGLSIPFIAYGVAERVGLRLSTNLLDLGVASVGGESSPVLLSLASVTRSLPLFLRVSAPTGVRLSLAEIAHARIRRSSMLLMSLAPGAAVDVRVSFAPSSLAPLHGKLHVDVFEAPAQNSPESSAEIASDEVETAFVRADAAAVPPLLRLFVRLRGRAVPRTGAARQGASGHPFSRIHGARTAVVATWNSDVTDAAVAATEGVASEPDARNCDDEDEPDLSTAAATCVFTGAQRAVRNLNRARYTTFLRQARMHRELKSGANAAAAAATIAGGTAALDSPRSALAKHPRQWAVNEGPTAPAVGTVAAVFKPAPTTRAEVQACAALLDPATMASLRANLIADIDFGEPTVSSMVFRDWTFANTTSLPVLVALNNAVSRCGDGSCKGAGSAGVGVVALMPPASQVVPPSRLARFRVRLSTSSPGVFSGSVLCTVNGEMPIGRVQLFAAVRANSLVLSTNELKLNFATGCTGASTSAQVTLSNDGSAPVHFDFVLRSRKSETIAADSSAVGLVMRRDIVMNSSARTAKGGAGYGRLDENDRQGASTKKSVIGLPSVTQPTALFAVAREAVPQPAKPLLVDSACKCGIVDNDGEGKDLRAWRLEPASGVVPAGGKLAVTVTYTPVAGALREVTFALDVAGGSVSGSQMLRLRGEQISSSLATAPSTLDFGLMRAGTKISRTLTLRNVCDEHAGAWRLAEPPPRGVDLEPDSGWLAPGATDTVRATFAPAAPTTLDPTRDFLVLRTRGGLTLRVPLQASAMLPRLTLMASTAMEIVAIVPNGCIARQPLDFDVVQVGRLASRAFVLANDSPVDAEFIVDLSAHPDFFLAADIASTNSEEGNAGAITRPVSGGREGSDSDSARGGDDDDDCSGIMMPGPDAVLQAADGRSCHLADGTLPASFHLHGNVLDSKSTAADDELAKRLLSPLIADMSASSDDEKGSATGASSIRTITVMAPPPLPPSLPPLPFALCGLPRTVALQLAPNAVMRLRLLFRPTSTAVQAFTLPVRMRGVDAPGGITDEMGAASAASTAGANSETWAVSGRGALPLLRVAEGSTALHFGAVPLPADGGGLRRVAAITLINVDACGRAVRWRAALASGSAAFALGSDCMGGLLLPGGRAALSVIFCAEAPSEHSSSVLVIAKAECETTLVASENLLQPPLTQQCSLRLSVSAAAVRPFLSFDVREVVLPTVPPGAAATANVYIIGHGFQRMCVRAHLLECADSSVVDAGAANCARASSEAAVAAAAALAVDFPDGNELTAARPCLPLRLTFCVAEPCAISAVLMVEGQTDSFCDSKPVVAAQLQVAACADASVLSLGSYLASLEATRVAYVCRPGCTAASGAVLPSPDAVVLGTANEDTATPLSVFAAQSPLQSLPRLHDAMQRLATEAQAVAGAGARIAAAAALAYSRPLPPLCTPVQWLARGPAAQPPTAAHTAALLRWLNACLFMAPGVAAFPQGLAETHGAPLFDAVEALTGTRLPWRERGTSRKGIGGGRFAVGEAISSAAEDTSSPCISRHLTSARALLAYLRARGSVSLCTVRPESLLCAQAYAALPLGGAAGDGGDASTRELAASLRAAAFPALSCDAWTAVCLQAVRIFVLRPRVTSAALLAARGTELTGEAHDFVRWTLLREAALSAALAAAEASKLGGRGSGCLIGSQIAKAANAAVIAREEAARNDGVLFTIDTLRQSKSSSSTSEASASTTAKKAASDRRRRAARTKSVEIDTTAVAAEAATEETSEAGEANSAAAPDTDDADPVACAAAAALPGSLNALNFERSRQARARARLLATNALVGDSNVYSEAESLLLLWLTYHRNRGAAAAALSAVSSSEGVSGVVSEPAVARSAVRARPQSSGGLRVSSPSSMPPGGPRQHAACGSSGVSTSLPTTHSGKAVFAPRRLVDFRADVAADVSTLIFVVLSHAPQLGSAGRPLETRRICASLLPTVSRQQRRACAKALLESLTELGLAPPFDLEDLCPGPDRGSTGFYAAAAADDTATTEKAALVSGRLGTSGCDARPEALVDNDCAVGAPATSKSGLLLAALRVAAEPLPLAAGYSPPSRFTQPVLGAVLPAAAPAAPPVSSDGAASPVLGLLWALWLFTVLPSMTPRALVDVECSLDVSAGASESAADSEGCREAAHGGNGNAVDSTWDCAATRALKLTNRHATETIDYAVTLEQASASSGNHAFAILSPSRFSLPPGTSTRVLVACCPRFTRPVHARLICTPVAASGKPHPPALLASPPAVFALRSFVTRRAPAGATAIAARVYGAATVDVEVRNCFESDALFIVAVVQLDESAISGENVPPRLAARLRAEAPSPYVVPAAAAVAALQSRLSAHSLVMRANPPERLPPRNAASLVRAAPAERIASALLRKHGSADDLREGCGSVSDSESDVDSGVEGSSGVNSSCRKSAGDDIGEGDTLANSGIGTGGGNARGPFWCRYAQVFLRAGQTKRLPVQFAPMRLGLHRAALVLTDAAHVLGEVVIELSGRATPPPPSATLEISMPARAQGSAHALFLAAALDAAAVDPPARLRENPSHFRLRLRVPAVNAQLEAAQDARVDRHARSLRPAVQAAWAARRVRDATRRCRAVDLLRTRGLTRRRDDTSGHRGAVYDVRAGADTGKSDADCDGSRASGNGIDVDVAVELVSRVGAFFDVTVDSPFIAVQPRVFVAGALSRGTCCASEGSDNDNESGDSTSADKQAGACDGVASARFCTDLTSPKLLAGPSPLRPSPQSLSAQLAEASALGRGTATKNVTLSAAQAVSYSGRNGGVAKRVGSADIAGAVVVTPSAVADVLSQGEPLPELQMVLMASLPGIYSARVTLSRAGGRDVRVYDIAVTVGAQAAAAEEMAVTAVAGHAASAIVRLPSVGRCENGTGAARGAPLRLVASCTLPPACGWAGPARLLAHAGAPAEYAFTCTPAAAGVYRGSLRLHGDGVDVWVALTIVAEGKDASG